MVTVPNTLVAVSNATSKWVTPTIALPPCPKEISMKSVISRSLIAPPLPNTSTCWGARCWDLLESLLLLLRLKRCWRWERSHPTWVSSCQALNSDVCLKTASQAPTNARKLFFAPAKSTTTWLRSVTNSVAKTSLSSASSNSRRSPSTPSLLNWRNSRKMFK